MDERESDGVPPVLVTSLEHRLTKEEIVPVVYRQVFHRWQNWLLPVAAVGLVVAGGLVLGLDPGNRVAWTVMLTLGVVLLVLFAILVPLTPSRIWKRVGAQFEVRTLTVSDEGVGRNTSLNDTVMRWAMFSGAIQRGDLYLLKVSKGPGYFIIPRRAFTSRSDEETFRSLVEQKLAAATLTPMDPVGSSPGPP